MVRLFNRCLPGFCSRFKGQSSPGSSDCPLFHHFLGLLSENRSLPLSAQEPAEAFPSSKLMLLWALRLLHVLHAPLVLFTPSARDVTEVWLQSLGATGFWCAYLLPGCFGLPQLGSERFEVRLPHRFPVSVLAHQV